MHLTIKMTAVIFLVALSTSVGYAKDEPTLQGTASVSSVSDGPLQPERLQLRQRIKNLDSLGVGITPYADCFNNIEIAVANKEPESNIHSMIDKLNRSLDNQLNYMSKIQTELKVKMVPLSQGRVSSTQIADVMNQRFKGQVPQGLNAQTLMQRVNSNPRAKVLWNQFQKSK